MGFHFLFQEVVKQTSALEESTTIHDFPDEASAAVSSAAVSSAAVTSHTSLLSSVLGAASISWSGSHLEWQEDCKRGKWD